MPLNKGYLTAKTDKASDETYTPRYAVLPLLKYIDKSKTIWCPFDDKDSEYVKVFQENGYNVIYSHIDEGKNFFDYEPKEPYDIIISNPPFSIKDEILHRCNELNKPYALLLPLPTLQGKERFDDLNGSQVLVFDKRICYFRDKSKTELQKGVSFASIYIGKQFLPQDLIFERLDTEAAD